MIQNRLRKYFSAFLLIPVILFCSILLIYLSINSWRDGHERLTNQLNYVGGRLDELLYEARQIGNSVCADESTLEALERSYATQEERYLSELEMDSKLSYVLRYFDSDVQLYVLAENGARCKSGRFSFLKEDYRSEDWYAQVRAGNDLIWFPISDRSRVVRSMPGLYIAMGLPVRARGGNETLGIVLVETQVDEALMELMEAGGSFYIMDTDMEMSIVGDTVIQYENERITTVSDGAVQVYDRSEDLPDFVNLTVDKIAYWRDNFEPTGFLEPARMRWGIPCSPPISGYWRAASPSFSSIRSRCSSF